ncbi:MAG: alanyl aminopeptidase [Saprospirales bacterium]|nr:alanyl aminopeptidase [Saprospirales bacterium]
MKFNPVHAVSFSIFLVFLSSCKTGKDVYSWEYDVLYPAESDDFYYDDEEDYIIPVKENFQASATRHWDLLHTKLDIGFDMEVEYVLGKAELTLTPYFYSQSEVVLDAKGMDLHSIMVNDKEVFFNYDGQQVTILLEGEVSRGENITVVVEYTAKPSELEMNTASDAIEDDRGLYFINARGEDPNKPIQIWTQGEPESNSVWFPTIDKPNERCTQEIFVTVENRFVTLSNGLLINSKENGDGTRTDYWKQDLPHAPYLFMLSIGDYAVVKDTWRDIDVHYFVEHEYENNARGIFKNTPEMLSFFSDVLRYDFPWDKYHQVAVRDFVSGAMENTSAVIFGDFVQQTAREQLDGDFEDIVSHELFHHWFGDLVTCESWANIPLNESFATYGEVMWREHKYGADDADFKRLDDRLSYFNEAQSKQVDLIRYDHDLPGDMFDRHSYEKGGAILHMLRVEVGDEAFYTALNKYLVDNAYSDVEIHELRIAFEDVTGRDFMPFFNQWFFEAGHPIVEYTISHTYDEYGEPITDLTFTQYASADDSLLYDLSIPYAIYSESSDTYEMSTFHLGDHMDWVFLNGHNDILIDPRGELLVEWDQYTGYNASHIPMYINQMKNAPWAYARFKAFNKLYFNIYDDDSLNIFYAVGLKDAFHKNRLNALESMNESLGYATEFDVDLSNLFSSEVLELVQDLATSDSNYAVQVEALKVLVAVDANAHRDFFIKALSSPSIAVTAEAMMAMADIDLDKALPYAEKEQNTTNYTMLDAVGTIYAQSRDAQYQDYFENYVNGENGEYQTYYAMYYYSKLIAGLDFESVMRGLDFFEYYLNNANGEYVSNVALSGMDRVAAGLNERLAEGELIEWMPEVEMRIEAISNAYFGFEDFEELEEAE